MSADQQATRQIQNEMAMTSNRLDNMETALMQITQQLQALTQLANNSKTNP
jgi:hypothetical protein